MSLAKAIIGGAIGAAIATAVWLGAENMAGRSMPWLALLVGLLAGLGVRCCCGQEQRSSLTGAIAAILALLGVVIGPVANQLWLEFDFQRQTKPIVRENSLDGQTESNDEDLLEDEDEDTVDESETSDDSADSAGGDAELQSATTPEADRSSTSMIAAARPYLAQVTGDGDEGGADVEGVEGIAGKSAIREFFDKNLELMLYAGSAILAYILGSGGKKKKEVETSAPEASG